jgi:ABC-2 type transport system permease protein
MVAVPLFGIAALVLLMATPLLSMRLIAGERRDRTLTFLFSAPLSLTEIVLGKFLGLLAFLAAVAALPALMALSLYAGGALDFGLVLANLLGLLLLAAAFAALGLFLSSLTSSPTLAGISSLGAFLGLWVVNMAVTDPNSALHTLSLLKHFESFNRGLVDSADMAYFLVFTATFLAFTVRRLDNQRLGG